MFSFVTGGSASGKSDYAETLACLSGAEKLFYVATMKNDGTEAEDRIEKHRKKRAGRNFITLECPYNIKDLTVSAPYGESAILLEDMGNLVANEQFDMGGSDAGIIRRVTDGLISLRRLAKTVIIVGDEICSDTGDYERETLRYMRLLAECDALAAGMADSVAKVICGIAVRLK